MIGLITDSELIKEVENLGHSLLTSRAVTRLRVGRWFSEPQMSNLFRVRM